MELLPTIHTKSTTLSLKEIDGLFEDGLFVSSKCFLIVTEAKQPF
jgi:hypothetical protein